MGAERGNYFVKVGDNRITFQGAKYWYGDGNVQSETGVKEIGDGTVDDGELQIDSSDAKKYLVQLAAVVTGQGLGGVGTNQQQSDRRRTIKFFCDPDKAEDAILNLPNKSVDPGLGLGSLRILKVYRPRRRVYV